MRAAQFIKGVAEEQLDEAIMTPQQVAAAKAAAPHGYNPQTGKPNPAPAATPAATPAPAAKEPIVQATDDMEQRILDRMGKRFGLPPGSSMEQVAAAQQAYLDKNDPAAAAQNKQNMANIDAGNTAANKPVQLAPKAAPAAPAAPAQDKNFAAGLAAAQAGKSPTEMMLAQPDIAGNQQLVDQVATTLGLPAGTPVEQVRAAAAKRATSATPAGAEQKAIDDMAAKQGFPAGLTKDQFYKMYQDKLNKQQAAMMPKPQTPPGVFGQFGKPPVAPAQAPTAAPAAPVAEANKEKIGGRYDANDFDDMVARLKKLAGAGPMRTVYDPDRRVYRNMPTAVQPKQQDKK